jgi:hypothetical protein
MQWADEHHMEDWVTLTECLFSRLIEPDPLQRSLDVLRAVPSLKDEEGLGDYLHARELENGALPDHSRQAILDSYFQHSYVEEERRP